MSAIAAIVGAAETNEVGKLPDYSVLGLHIEAAVNAVTDAGLSLADIDGIATASSVFAASRIPAQSPMLH